MDWLPDAICHRKAAFGSIPRSFFTLFCIFLLDDWSAFVLPVLSQMVADVARRGWGVGARRSLYRSKSRPDLCKPNEPRGILKHRS